MTFSIRKKILIVFTLLSLVPLALLSIVGIYAVNTTQRYNISQLEHQLLTQKEKEIEKFLTDVKTLFHVQVASQVSALSGIPFDQQEFLLEEMVRANRYITEVSFVEYDASYPEKAENGMELVMRMSDGSTRTLEDRKTSPAFKKAILGEDYFGSVFIKNEEYFLPVAAPVKNRDGVIVGVITGNVSLKPVIRVVTDGILGNKGYLMLTDDKGEMLAAPQNLPMVHFGSQVFILSVLGGFAGSGSGDQEEYQSSFGDTVIASGKKLKDVNWALVAEWPKADAYAVVYSIERQAGIFLALILGVVAIATLLFARRITAPLETLKKGAATIGAGNLNHRILIQTGDELEDLAARFNEMAKSLKDIESLKEAKARMEGLTRSLAKEKELSQVKDHFIATASHQLRTPISVIRWISEMLKSTDIPGASEEIKEQFETLYKNTGALALVIGDLLTISELGIGYAPKIVSEFSLKEKFDQALSGRKRDYEAKKIKLSVDIPEADYRVKASLLNIERVFENLIDNAITYTQEGGEIRVSFIAGEGEIRCSLKNTGIVIPAEDQKFIFGEFFRARNAIDMKNVGTGLGLFIVKTIIEGHKGTVGFVSPAEWKREQGATKEGAEFFFTLPWGLK